MKRNLLFILVFIFSKNFYSQDVPISELNALLEFYQSTNSCSNWTNHTNWNTSQPVKNWYGITTTSELGISGQEQVVSIILGFNGLCGTIPESIGDLTKLRDFRIHGNSLYGELPTTLPNLTDLRTLIVYGNNFTGNIGELLTNATNLTSLDIHNNNFTGYINLTNNSKLTSFLETSSFDWSNSTASTNQIDAVLFANGKNNITTDFIIKGTKCVTVDNPINATNSVSPYNNGGAFKVKWFNNTKNFRSDCSAFLSTNEIQKQKIKIYPNPVKNILTIDTDFISKIEIYNQNGQLIDTFFSKTINLSNLPNSVYILKIETKNENLLKRIIKE